MTPADVAHLPCLDAAAAVLAAELLPEVEAVLAEVAPTPPGRSGTADPPAGGEGR